MINSVLKHLFITTFILTIWTIKASTSSKIEQYYRHFKKGNYSQALKVYRSMNKKSYLYKKYRRILVQGNNIINRVSSSSHCSFKSENHKQKRSHIFALIYEKKCLHHTLKLLYKSNRKFLTKQEKLFLKNNFKQLVGIKELQRLKRRYKKLKKNEQLFLSQHLESYITEHNNIPRSDIMFMLIPNSRITHFIQKNRLYDKKYHRHYNNKLKSLINSFKTQSSSNGKLSLLKKIEVFYKENEPYINDKKLWKEFMSFGKKLVHKENFDDAIAFYKLSERILGVEVEDEKAFHVIFTKYLNNDIHQARKYIRDKNLISNFDKLDSRLMYWSAYILDLNKELKVAKTLYFKTIEKHPLSFYSILSLKRLQKFTPLDPKDLMLDNASFLNQTKIAKKTKDYFKELKLHQKANNLIFTRHISNLLRTSNPYNFCSIKCTKREANYHKTKILVEHFSKSKLHLESFKMAYKSIDQYKLKLNQNTIDSLFPRSFSRYVKRVNKNYDYRIVLSLIRQESGFNKRARSPAGARGLMQIMPRTGKYLKKGLKTKELFNPKTNIRLGSKYLKYLLKKYKGNLMFALAAYNAGEGNVAKWKKRIPFTGDVISDIELIPFKETKKYVKLIYRNLFFYRLSDNDTKRLQETPEQTFKNWF